MDSIKNKGGLEKYKILIWFLFTIPLYFVVKKDTVLLVQSLQRQILNYFLVALNATLRIMLNNLRISTSWTLKRMKRKGLIYEWAEVQPLWGYLLYWFSEK